MPGRAKSASDTFFRGAPNSRSAANTSFAFSAFAATHRSKSRVERGCPWAPSAYAPTTMNRTRCATNNRNRSTLSGRRRNTGDRVDLEAELPDFVHPVFRRDPRPVPGIELLVGHLGLFARPHDSGDPL